MKRFVITNLREKNSQNVGERGRGWGLRLVKPISSLIGRVLAPTRRTAPYLAPPPTDFAVDRSEAVENAAARFVAPVGVRDEDDVAFIPLEVLEVFDEKRLLRSG